MINIATGETSPAITPFTSLTSKSPLAREELPGKPQGSKLGIRWWHDGRVNTRCLPWSEESGWRKYQSPPVRWRVWEVSQDFRLHFVARYLKNYQMHCAVVRRRAKLTVQHRVLSCRSKCVLTMNPAQAAKWGQLGPNMAPRCPLRISGAPKRELFGP